MRQDTTGRALHVIMVFISVVVLCVSGKESFLRFGLVHKMFMLETSQRVAWFGCVRRYEDCMLNPSEEKLLCTGHLSEAFIS